jgi:hypothetical protein
VNAKTLIESTVPPKVNGSMKPVAEERVAERVERARRAFHAFRSLCFWSWPEDSEITEETIPLIVQGLRKYGGHKGYRAAAELCR